MPDSLPNPMDFPTSAGSVTWNHIAGVLNYITGTTLLTSADVTTLTAMVTTNSVKSLEAAFGKQMTDAVAAEVAEQTRKDIRRLAEYSRFPLASLGRFTTVPDSGDDDWMGWMSVLPEGIQDADLVDILRAVAPRTMRVIAAQTGMTKNQLIAFARPVKLKYKKPRVPGTEPDIDDIIRIYYLESQPGWGLPARSVRETLTILFDKCPTQMLAILAQRPQGVDVMEFLEDWFDERRRYIQDTRLGIPRIPNEVAPPEFPIDPPIEDWFPPEPYDPRPKLRTSPGRPRIIPPGSIRNMGAGRALEGGDFTLHANWGTGAAVANLGPGYSPTLARFRLTLATGSSPGANPTILLTPSSGDAAISLWDTAPMVVCNVSCDDVTVTPGTVHAYWDATGLHIQYKGTPTASKNYIIDCLSVL